MVVMVVVMVRFNFWVRADSGRLGMVGIMVCMVKGMAVVMVRISG